MKNRFTITISDAHGVRHYTFSQLVKRFVGWGVLLLLVVLVVGALTIQAMKEEISDLQARREAAQQAYDQSLREQAARMAALKEQNARLAHALDEREQRLGALDQAVRSLEAFLGADVAPETPLEARVAHVRLTAAEKKLLLQLVPNGRPVEVFRGVSSSFGWRKHPISGNREFHKGLDYRGKVGDKIIATADGVVEYAGYHKSSGYGNMVLLDHNFGFRTLYGHLKKVLVKSGQVVHKGQVIALMGNTGLSTGSHLHYEVSFVQRALNPEPFVMWSLTNYDAIFKQVGQVPWDSLASRVRAYLATTAPPSSPKAVSSEAKSAD